MIDLAIIDDARAERRRYRTVRARWALAVSFTITVIWACSVTAFSQWPRVAGHWVSSLTMVFGSFVAGATPQGGGAVAFPVFTKLLEVPAEVARTFSLCIQSVGMGAASASILLNRHPVEWRAVGLMTASGAAGFLACIGLASDMTRPFMPSVLPGAYVKVTFTIVLLGMAWLVYSGSRVPMREIRRVLPALTPRIAAVMALLGVVGGVASALVGSGADVLLYLAVVVLLTLDTRVGVPTSVVSMALISWLGLATLGLLDGQLRIELVDGGVASVGGLPVTLRDGQAAFGTGPPLPATRFDLLGLWLAAVPVVCWGAPLGAWVASRVPIRMLVAFVASLAALEVLSTSVFLSELRTDRALLGYAVVGSAATLWVLRFAARHRASLFDLPALDLEQSLNRERLDLAPGFREHLRPGDGSRRP